ncbi:MAG: hypothetical protein KDK33_19045, partial [Leptospiraceae bacterium]|nr:hypothetical protein [Leptospiraceae bacterium]
MLLPFQNLPGRFEGDESIAGACLQSDGFFFKFLSANETGATGSHQAGFYIHRQAYWLFFPQPGKKGENSFRDIEIEWADGTVTSSRFTWYGKGNKSEYRITKGLHFLGEENTGDLLVLARKTDGFFKGFLLAQENSIEAFLDELSLNPSHSGQAFRIAGGAIQAEEEQSELNGFEQSLNEALQDCLQNPDSPFPTA